MPFYEGEYKGTVEALVHLCDIEGSAEPHDRPPFNTFEEACRVLDMCGERYSTPAQAPALTVFIGRKTDAIIPLARLDIVVKDGQAYCNVMRDDTPRIDLEPVAVASDDDVVAVARKVLNT